MVERNFKGIWIPKEVWLNPDLTIQEKVMLVEIDSLDNEDGCFAGNKYFAEFFQLSLGRVSQIIKSLEEKGLIEIDYIREGKEFNKRTIRVVNKLKRVFRILKRGSLGNDEDNNTSILNNTINNKNSIYLLNDFNEFWELYPKKVAKQQAIKSWKKINPDEVLLEIIFNQLKKFKRTKEWQEKEGQFIPHPSTWLNNKRWEDEIDIQEEQTPTWFDSDLKKEELSEEERKELEDWNF